jgi:predicted DNA-binding WGR domain protein
MRKKTFFFIGQNRNTKFGLSAKIWQIWREEKTVHTRWGPAALKNRQPVFGGWRQEWKRGFRSEAAAQQFLVQRVGAKRSKGYKPRPALRTARITGS